ncbi:type II secretion system F family protein [Belnapia rosea]|uniref:General secretion pathway protein F n=1 Tax=Belnapia rosea TaxID=938405 RepID=A0A1G7DT25_9PROT|nr:type II secretion system F family protein [Belnapia rosea]SDB74767.1 general secretion pathway protein F [Belnapia rosea]SDE54055.1 general secretion pathway protein F [Belnapia rosea]
MASFRYTVIDPSGKLRRGKMEGADEAEVIARLRRQGNTPVRAEPASGSRLATLLSTRLAARRGLPAQAVADLLLELATMLGAGQDLDQALRYLQTAASTPRAARVATGLRDAVRDGSPLSVAMAQQPESFRRLHIGLVRAGEAGGTLGPTVAQLADLLQRQRSLAASINSALIYPCLLLASAAGSVALLLTQVLPQFVPLFEQSGKALPASTQLLIDLSDAASRHGPWLLVLALAGLVAMPALLRRPGPRLLIDRALLRLPVIGGLVQEVLAARFSRVLGTLLGNGVPLIAALGVVREVLGNAAAAAAVDSAATAARGGGSLTQPLQEAGIFPPRTIHLLRLGEETAQLAPMALRAAAIHEERTQLATQRLLALLVPGITILMGLVVAGIVVAMLTAMLGMNDLAEG